MPHSDSIDYCSTGNSEPKKGSLPYWRSCCWDALDCRSSARNLRVRSLERRPLAKLARPCSRRHQCSIATPS